MKKIYKIIFIFFAFWIICDFCYAQQRDTYTMQVLVSVEESLVTVIEGDLKFRSSDFSKDGAQLQKNIKVNTSSNAGVPYQVILTMNCPLTNEKGLSIPMKSVKLYVSNGMSGGRSEVPSPVSAEIGEKQIFSSNVFGDSDSFTASFIIELDKLTPAGKYYTSINMRATIK